MYGSRLWSLSSPAHSPFRCRHRSRPVRDRFVRDGSTPPDLAAVVSGDRRFGRALDDDDNGLPLQSVSNIDRVMTSSSCSLSLLVSFVFVVVLLFPKHNSHSGRRNTSKKLLVYPPASALVSSSSSVAMPLPSSPSRSSRPMNNTQISISGIDVVAVARLRRRHGVHLCRGDRAEEDPVCQDDEGVVQAASGVGSRCGRSELCSRRCERSRPPRSLGRPLASQTMTILLSKRRERGGGGGWR